MTLKTAGVAGIEYPGILTPGHSRVKMLVVATVLMAKLVMGCADRHANYDIRVENVTINPDPVVSGQEMTFTVPAYTGE